MPTSQVESSATGAGTADHHCSSTPTTTRVGTSTGGQSTKQLLVEPAFSSSLCNRFLRAHGDELLRDKSGLRVCLRWSKAVRTCVGCILSRCLLGAEQDRLNHLLLPLALSGLQISLFDENSSHLISWSPLGLSVLAGAPCVGDRLHVPHRASTVHHPCVTLVDCVVLTVAADGFLHAQGSVCGQGNSLGR